MSFIPTGAAPDKAAFTEGTTPAVPVAGEYNDSTSGPASGQLAAVRITPNRALHINLRRQDGTELATSTAPLYVSDAALEALISSGALKVTDAAAESSLATVAGAIASGTMKVSDAALEALISSGSLKVSDSALEKLIVGSSLSTIDYNLQTAISTGKVNIAGAVTVSGGNLTVGVTNQTQDASGALKIAVGSAGKSYPQFVPDKVLYAEYQGSASAIVTGAPGYFLTSIHVSIDPTAASGANYVVFGDSNGGPSIWGFRFALPTSRITSFTAPTSGLEFMTPAGWFFKNSTANSSLGFFMSAAMTGSVMATTITYGILNAIY